MLSKDRTVAIFQVMAGLAIAGHMTFMIPIIIVVGLVIAIKQEFVS